MKNCTNPNPTLLLLFLILFSQVVFAQIEQETNDSIKGVDPYKKRAFVALGGGLARPIGNFSNQNTESTNSALAKNGTAFNLIEFDYRLFDKFHLSLGYWSIQNGVDEQAVARRLIAQNGNQYKVNATNYELRMLVAGVGLTKSSNSVDFDIRFQASYGSAFSPSFEIDEFDPITNTQRTYNNSTEKQSGFGAGIAMAFRIHLNQYLDLKPSANYFIFQSEFNNLSLNSGLPTEINYEILCLNIGIAYRFIQD